MGRTIVLLVSVIISCSLQPVRADDKDSKLKIPAYLSIYDFATADDLLFARQLEPFVGGSRPKDWLILKDIDKKLGGWITFSTANLKNYDLLSDESLPI